MVERIGHPEPIELGNFASGERPDPLVYGFLDYTGEPIDITGATIEFFIQYEDEDPVAGTGATAIASGSDFEGQYAWTDTDMAVPGHYQGMMWMSKDEVVFASPPIKWYVYQGVRS